MVTVSGKMIQVLLTILVFLFVLGIITPLINWSVNEDFRCRASVWLTANNIGPGLACQPQTVPVTERDLERDDGARLIAEQMLECNNLFDAGGTSTVLDYKWIAPRFSSIQSPVRFAGRLPRGDLAPKNYCFICSVIEFERDHEVSGFTAYLQTDGFAEDSFYTALYGENPAADRYASRTEDTLGGRVWVIYSEGNEDADGGSITPGSAVVAIDTESLQDDETMGFLCGAAIETTSEAT